MVGGQKTPSHYKRETRKEFKVFEQNTVAVQHVFTRIKFCSKYERTLSACFSTAWLSGYKFGRILVWKRDRRRTGLLRDEFNPLSRSSPPKTVFNSYHFPLLPTRLRLLSTRIPTSGLQRQLLQSMKACQSVHLAKPLRSSGPHLANIRNEESLVIYHAADVQC